MGKEIALKVLSRVGFALFIYGTLKVFSAALDICESVNEYAESLGER